MSLDTVREVAAAMPCRNHQYGFACRPEDPGNYCDACRLKAAVRSLEAELAPAPIRRPCYKCEKVAIGLFGKNPQPPCDCEVDPKDPQFIANNPDAIRALALEAKKDLGPLLQVVAQAVVLHDLDPMWLEYVARHYAEAHEDIPVPLEIKLGPREFIFELATDGFDADTAERFSQWYAGLSQHNG